MADRLRRLTVVELPGYLSKAEKIMTEAERTDVVTLVSSDPTCGDVMAGTGGVRKVRVALEGRGKRGGARVVYFFHNETIPVFLLTVFAKNEKDNLTPAERNALAVLVPELVRGYGR